MNGITSRLKNPKREICFCFRRILDIISLSFQVDEEGTVGAGVTGISVVPLSLPPPFTCNSPFLLLVYEKKTQNIIFIGRIVDPTADSS